MLAPWDIYAQKLLHLGHGHPLWGPEPSDRFGEIRLGDVGYLEQGRFCFLFNTMKEGNDPINSRGVPEGFSKFDPPDSKPIHWKDAITRTELHSKSLRAVEISTTGSASGSVASASVGLRYKCHEDSGAILLLKQPAHKTFLACKLHIKRYMEKHLDSWCNFANDHLGIGLSDKDIVFVSGFMKTTVWAEAAFRDTSRSCELVIAGGCFVPSVSGEFRVSISEGVAFHDAREGPRDRLSAWKDDGSLTYEYDQCVFFNYYKMKKRDRRRKPHFMQAAAGPHVLPDDRDDDESAPDISQSSSPYSDSQEDVGKSYDPVNDVLDYILKSSTVDVDIAFASDQDLSSLFGESGIPTDLHTALENLAPEIIQGDCRRTIGRIAHVCDKDKTSPTNLAQAPRGAPSEHESGNDGKEGGSFNRRAESSAHDNKTIIRSYGGYFGPVADSWPDATMTVHDKEPQTSLNLRGSQLFKAAGTSINIFEPTASSRGSAPIPGPPQPTLSLVQSRKRPARKVVCVNCRNAKKQCDGGRPCARCLKMRLGGCEDAPTKRQTPASSGSNGGAALSRRPESTSSNSSVMHQVPSFGPTHMARQDGAVMYGSASLPSEQTTHSVSWSEGRGGPSTFHAGTTGQAMYSYDPSAQNFTHLTQPAIPPLAALTPQPGHPSTSGPAMDMAAFQYYPPEHAAAFRSDNSIPGSAHPQYFGMHSSRESGTTNNSYYEHWQGQ